MMLRKQSGLGRGLGALIPPKPADPPAHPSVQPPSIPSAVSPPSLRVPPSVPAVEAVSMDSEPREGVREIRVADIIPNPHQPRLLFEPEGMEELMASIKEHGVIQPIVVSPRAGGGYELIAGERRFRSAKLLGMTHIPAVIRSATDQQKLELALIENIQRRNLNPIEEAKAYFRLRDEFYLSLEDISQRVGKSRSQVSNMIRLLDLEPVVQDALSEGKISTSNARTLLSIPNREERLAVFEHMLAGKMTVRQAEERVPQERRKPRAVDPNMHALEQALRERIGLRVHVHRKPSGAGEVRIGFQNAEDLIQLQDALNIHVFG